MIITPKLFKMVKRHGVIRMSLTLLALVIFYLPDTLYKIMVLNNFDISINTFAPMYLCQNCHISHYTLFRFQVFCI